MITFKLKTFRELSNEELYALLRLRAEVFVVEQNCPYQDLDGKDDQALHLCVYFDEGLIAYARLFAPGISYKEASVGRVVVNPAHRGKGFGIELMKQALTECKKQFGAEEIVISAQKYLEKFYTELGFMAEGSEYTEDNIPHIKMRWKK